MLKIIVLGGGLVGQVMARDLAADPDISVTVVDRDPQLLESLAAAGLATKRLDLADLQAVRAAIADADAVVGAAPGHMGFALLRTVIEAGKPYADIAFMPEDFLELDALARQHQTVAVVDCGVAPGLSNFLCGRANAELDSLQRVSILVGGLPKRRVWPYEYRIVFSPIDVIEEYTRPARYIEAGVEVVRPALSEIEPVELPRVGTLEAFNTDGLRSLAQTLKAPYMKEKTMRYPGHAEKMRMLRETGFFSSEPLGLPGGEVRPLDLTSRLLFDAWRLPPGEDDLTVMRVEVEGLRQGRACTITWDLYDERDPQTGYTSMARTTGFPCAIVARLLAKKEITRPGVLPPELLGGDERIYATMLAELERRKVVLQRSDRERPLIA